MVLSLRRGGRRFFQVSLETFRNPASSRVILNLNLTRERGSLAASTARCCSRRCPADASRAVASEQHFEITAHAPGRNEGRHTVLSMDACAARRGSREDISHLFLTRSAETRRVRRWPKKRACWTVVMHAATTGDRTRTGRAGRWQKSRLLPR